VELTARPEQVAEIARLARDSAAEVIVTPSSRPSNLGARLTQQGLQVVRLQQVRYLGRFPAHWGPSPVQVRRAGPNDLALWSTLVQQAYGLPANHRAHSAEATARAVRECGDRLTCYLAYLGGRPAGTVQTYRSGDVWRVAALGTLPDFRRQGVARALLWQAAQDWAQAGGRLLFLEHAPAGPARALYERLGMPLAYERVFYSAVGSSQ